MIQLNDIPRNDLKSILAQILENQGPRSRMEIFARQAGYRSDAAMTAETAPLDASPAALARASAEGRVLPQLVMSAFPEVSGSGNRRSTARSNAPRADDILKASSTSLDRKTFKENLGDILLAARTAPEGLPRWFFSVAVSDVLLEPPAASDKFWLTKAAVQLCGILAMVDQIPAKAGIHEGLVADLAALPDDELTPWEIQGRRLLEHRMPPQTQSSIFATMVGALPHETWPRQDSASGRALRPGILPTEAWRHSQ
jgi:hypothetical protein